MKIIKSFVHDAVLQFTKNEPVDSSGIDKIFFEIRFFLMEVIQMKQNNPFHVVFH